MKKRSNNRGSASTEMLIAMPLVLVAVTGLIMLFGAHFARQRMFAALPEISRLALENTHVREFSPTRDATCTIEGLVVHPTTSLNELEKDLCLEAGYVPPTELRRIGFAAETVSRAVSIPGLAEKIRMNTSYQVTRLTDRWRR